MTSTWLLLPLLCYSNRFIHVKKNKYSRNIVLNTIRKCWSVQINDNRDVVSLKDVSTGRILKFPSVWLRDNCQCEECFDPATNSRLIGLQNLDVNAKPISHRVSKESDGVSLLHVQWSNSHQSTFNTDWLKQRSFDSQRQSKWLSEVYRPKRIPWNVSNYKNIISEFSYQSLLAKDEELLKFLSNLDVYGIAVVKDAGVDRDRLKELVRRIGFEKKTFYGESYLVESKPDTTNLAYGSNPLQLHLDLPYFEYCPGVNMLHYIVQADDENEGVNQLVCGLNACKQLKELHAEHYKALTEIPVEWIDVGTDSGYQFHTINHAPIICEDSSGEILRLNFSQVQRDSQFCVSLSQAIEWYEAVKNFIEILHSSENLVSLKMKPGDILAFDNRRILHGRSGFNSERCLLGTYMDWDVIRSKIRVLKFNS